MAEHAILNPVRGTTKGTHDNFNPDYNAPRSSPDNSQIAKTRLGRWYQRDVGNAGYSFDMSWVARPWTTMLRLVEFYNNFKAGYFTYIDWDAGERHHVGRFTSVPKPAQLANGKWNCQMTFEEVPGARMLTYPANYMDWGRVINVVDDDLIVAAGLAGTWSAQLNPTILGASATDPNAYELFDAQGASGDFAQIQYVGWGFTMTFRPSNLLGICNILVDNVLLQEVDLSGPNPTTITNTQMPLDVHRVKVAPVGQPGASSASPTTFGTIFPQIRVIV